MSDRQRPPPPRGAPPPNAVRRGAPPPPKGAPPATARRANRAPSQGEDDLRRDSAASLNEARSSGRWRDERRSDDGGHLQDRNGSNALAAALFDRYGGEDGKKDASPKKLAREKRGCEAADRDHSDHSTDAPSQRPSDRVASRSAKRRSHSPEGSSGGSGRGRSSEERRRRSGRKAKEEERGLGQDKRQESRGNDKEKRESINRRGLQESQSERSSDDAHDESGESPDNRHARRGQRESGSKRAKGHSRQKSGESGRRKRDSQDSGGSDRRQERGAVKLGPPQRRYGSDRHSHRRKHPRSRGDDDSARGSERSGESDVSNDQKGAQRSRKGQKERSGKPVSQEGLKDERHALRRRGGSRGAQSDDSGSRNSDLDQRRGDGGAITSQAMRYARHSGDGQPADDTAAAHVQYGRRGKAKARPSDDSPSALAEPSTPATVNLPESDDDDRLAGGGGVTSFGAAHALPDAVPVADSSVFSQAAAQQQPQQQHGLGVAQTIKPVQGLRPGEAIGAKAKPFDPVCIPMAPERLREFLLAPFKGTTASNTSEVALRCFLERERGGTNLLSPTFILYADLGDGNGRLLMAARKIVRSRKAHYVICTNKEDLKRTNRRGSGFLGKLRLAPSGEYVLYDGGASPRAAAEPKQNPSSTNNFDETAGSNGNGSGLFDKDSDHDHGDDGSEAGAAEQHSGRRFNVAKRIASSERLGGALGKTEAGLGGGTMKSLGSTAGNGGGGGTLLRKELAVVTYDFDKKAEKSKRRMEVAIPKVHGDGCTVEMWQPNDARGSMAGAFARVRYQGAQNLLMSERVFILHQRESRYDALSSCLVDFKGRATAASVKNFQLIASVPENNLNRLRYYNEGDGRFEDAGDDVPRPVRLQMGKAGKNCFNVDIQYPLSVLQAFAVCLSRFDTHAAH